MAEKAVDTPEKAEPLTPGKPVEQPAVTQLGATFAERAGKKPPKLAQVANTTFADRAKAAGKQVKADDAEDKTVKSAQGKAKG